MLMRPRYVRRGPRAQPSKTRKLPLQRLQSTTPPCILVHRAFGAMFSCPLPRRGRFGCRAIAYALVFPARERRKCHRRSMECAWCMCMCMCMCICVLGSTLRIAAAGAVSRYRDLRTSVVAFPFEREHQSNTPAVPWRGDDAALAWAVPGGRPRTAYQRRRLSLRARAPEQRSGTPSHRTRVMRMVCGRVVSKRPGIRSLWAVPWRGDEAALEWDATGSRPRTAYQRRRLSLRARAPEQCSGTPSLRGRWCNGADAIMLRGQKCTGTASGPVAGQHGRPERHCSARRPWRAFLQRS